MGGRKAMADSASTSAVGAARAPQAGGTLLWRPRRRAGAETLCGAVERRQPAPDQLLPLAPARIADSDADGERRTSLLSLPRSVQRALRRGAGRERRSGGALLLSEPHVVQWPLPLQPPGTVQRSVRALRAHPVHPRLFALPANVLRVELYEPRRRSAAAQARRLRLCGSSLRRAVHALCPRRLQLARSRKDRTPVVSASRSGDPGEPSHRSHGELVSVAR